MKKILLILALTLLSYNVKASELKDLLEARYQYEKSEVEDMEDESYKDIAFHDIMDMLPFTYPDCKKYYFLINEYYEIAFIKDYEEWLDEAESALEFLKTTCKIERN